MAVASSAVRLSRQDALPQPVESSRQSISAVLFLVLLLSGDLAFVFLHFASRATEFLHDPLLSLEKDRGYPEFYQYIKELWIIVLLIALCVRTKVFRYVAWVCLFGYLLLDDALQLHEKLGTFLTNHLNIESRFGLRGQDFGELCVTAVAGIVLLSLLIACYARGSAAFKQSSRHLVLLLMLLVAFGVGVDMLHSLCVDFHAANVAFVALEDGGEMVAVSLIVAYVFLLNMRDNTALPLLVTRLPPGDARIGRLPPAGVG